MDSGDVEEQEDRTPRSNRSIAMEIHRSKFPMEPGQTDRYPSRTEPGTKPGRYTRRTRSAIPGLFILQSKRQSTRH